LRVFTTFKPTSKSFDSLIKKRKKKEMPLGPDGMITRTSEEKPYKSRTEILEKLQKNEIGDFNKSSKPVKGKKFGMDFMDVGKGPIEPKGDIAKNNPRDPMTTEKLKSMLYSGAVNFSGKEQQILSQILGK
jgi:hypothetical protein